MQDDDLMSLDFTVPGAFHTQPKEAVAPEIPAPPARPSRAPLPPALAEAATLYAAGRELEAMRRLEAAIKSGEDLGDAEVRAWGCLLELLQVLGRRPPLQPGVPWSKARIWPARAAAGGLMWS